MCSTFSGPFWNGFCPSCIDDACGNGEGESVGLPAVPEEFHDDVVVWMEHHEREHSDKIHDNCMACHLAAEVCDECDLEARDMVEEDEAAHLIAGWVILIGCEGYHEPVFRYVYWAEIA